jgi:hypothetical protein
MQVDLVQEIDAPFGCYEIDKAGQPPLAVQDIEEVHLHTCTTN